MPRRNRKFDIDWSSHPAAEVQTYLPEEDTVTIPVGGMQQIIEAAERRMNTLMTATEEPAEPASESALRIEFLWQAMQSLVDPNAAPYRQIYQEPFSTGPLRRLRPGFQRNGLRISVSYTDQEPEDL